MEREVEKSPDHDAAGFGNALQYATTWFTYHAGQRIQTFNFFLVIQTGLLVALFSGWGSVSKALLIALAVLGVGSGPTFWLLEVRNTELVNAGREALDHLESYLQPWLPEEKFPRRQDKARTTLLTASNDASRHQGWVYRHLQTAGEPSRWFECLVRHALLFRVMTVLALVGWASFLIWAAIAYAPGSH